MGLTFAQKEVEGKSNEIPAVQELLKELNIKNSIVVADIMHCQKETVKIIVDGVRQKTFAIAHDHIV